MDYLSYCRLNDDPFRLTPDPQFFYPTSVHNDALFSLEYMVEQREGFSLILGPPGSGKTTIIRVFMAKWKEKADIALIMTPRLSPEEFIQALLEDLDVRAPGGNKNEMIKALRDILMEKAHSGRRVVVIVDEAQDLPEETLEELRLLSNLETEKEKLLQIVLVGQPELARKLSSEKLEQLDQRIGLKTILAPLNAKETQDYVNYRLIRAGRGSVVFQDNAVELIYKLSKGVPRLINLLASRALMASCVDGSCAVEKIHVGYAKRHLFPMGKKKPARPKLTKSPGARRTSLRAKLMPYAIACLIFIVAMSVVFAKVGPPQKGTGPGKGQPPVASVGLDQGTKEKPQSLHPPAPAGHHRITLSKRVTFFRDGNLRKGPSRHASVLTWARKGTVFVKLGEKKKKGGGKWYKVRIAHGGTAWVSSAIAKAESAHPYAGQTGGYFCSSAMSLSFASFLLAPSTPSSATTSR